MAEPRFSMSADEDLPRTLRREKEARAREAAAAMPAATDTGPYAGTAASYEPSASGQAYGHPGVYDLEPVVVRRFDVPFFRLVAFFLKATLAAIPALILLTAILIGIGQALKAFFPWLVQAKILIDLGG